MSKRMIRVLSVIISLSLTAVALAGCGSGSSKNTNTEKSSSGQESGSTKDQSKNEDSGNQEADKIFEGLKFKPGKMDLGGRTMVFSGWNVVPEKGVNANWDRMFKLREKTEKKYNVKIQDVAVPEASFVEEVITKYSAGIKFADVIFCPSNYGLSLLKAKGLVKPLDDYIDYEGDRFKNSGRFSQYIDGKHYSMAEVGEVIGNVVYYNEDILKREGIEDILELYKKGQWNWAKLEEIAKKCTKDIDGDGVNDQYGIAGSMILNNILASNGVKLVDLDVKSGKFVSGLFSEPGYNALNFLRKLMYEDKVVEYSTYGGHNGITTMKEGKSAMILAPTFYGQHFAKAGLPYKSAPLPVGDDVKSSVVMPPFAAWNLLSAVSDFTPEEVITVWMDAGRNDPNDPDTYIPDTEQDKLDQFIVTYVDANNDFRTEAEGEFWYKFATDPNTNAMLDFSFNEITNLLVEKVFNPLTTGEDPRSYLESIKPVVDDVFTGMMPK